MGNKSTKQKAITSNASTDDYKDNDAKNSCEIIELSEKIIKACIDNYYRNNETINNLAVIPKEIGTIIINYSFYFVISSKELLKLNKSLPLSSTSLPSQEAVFSLQHCIQSILKQIQSKFDKHNFNNQYIRFTNTNYNKFKTNKITMEFMTDIAIDFIHNALISTCVTREDIGDFLTHWNTFNDNDTSCYKFLYCYLKKHGLYEFCQQPDNDLLQSLKYFIKNCEFDFPREARKIERLLEPFATIYCEMNKVVDDGIWSNSDNVFISVNMLLMINTSIHNVRIKQKDKINMQQVEAMCGSVNTTNKKLYIQRMLQMAQNIKDCKL